MKPHKLLLAVQDRFWKIGTSPRELAGIDQIHNAITKALNIVSPTIAETLECIDGAKQRCALESVFAKLLVYTIEHVLT
jgi:hypothetical protein